MTSATLVERGPRLRTGNAAVALARGIALALGLGGLALVGRGAIRSLGHLYWSPGQVVAALDSLAGLVAAHPLRAILSLGVGVGAMLFAELRPHGFRKSAVAAWLLAGWAGSLVYLLSALGVASLPAIEGIAAVALCGLVAHLGRSAKRAGRRSDPIRPVGVGAAVGIGAIAGVILLRASLEVITEWDAIIYHASFARDWTQTLPSLPAAAGPSLGAEMSYSYPALFPSLAVTLSRGLALPIADAIRLISPLAFITVLGMTRAFAGRGRGSVGWLAAALVLGSPLAVSYAEWPTAYALLTLLVLLAAGEILFPISGRRSDALVVGGLLGLVAATAVVGIVFAAMLGLASMLVWRRRGRARHVPVQARLVTARQAGAFVLAAAPLAAVCVASVRRTDGLFFPWVTWPHAAHLLPHSLWSAARREIVTNAFSETSSAVGEIAHPLGKIVLSPLLFPGGLAVAAAAAVGLVFALAPRRAGSRAVLVLGLAAAAVALVVAQLVWLRYFVVAIPAAAMALAGVAEIGSGHRSGRGRVPRRLVLAAATATACVCALAGASLGLAGPNDYTWTALQDYAGQQVSAFDAPRAVTDVQGRLKTVFGDDARAWRDIDSLDASGLGVGTFDVRNYYAPYRPGFQLDGLAAARIDGTTADAIAAELRKRGIGAVFVPSWFWEPGGAAHPLAKTSPVMRWVGAPTLRAWRVYLPERGVSAPSVLYRVGTWTGRDRVAAASLQSTPPFSVAVPPAARTAFVDGAIDFSGALGGRVGNYRAAAPVTEYGSDVYRLVLHGDAGAGTTIFEPRQPTLFQPIGIPQCAGMPAYARDAVTDFQFPGSPLGYAVLDLGSSQRQTVSGRLEQRPAGVPGSTAVLTRACGDPATAQGGVFPAGSLDSRIVILPHGRRSVRLAFEYRDDAASPVAINAYDARHRRWLYGVASIGRCSGGGWRTGTLQIPTGGQERVELGLVVQSRNLEMRDLRALPSSAAASGVATVSALACGDATTARGATFAAGSTAGRIVVAGRGDAPLRLHFDYLDRGRAPVTLNVLDTRRNRWIYDVAQIARRGTGRWLHATVTVPLRGQSTVQLGPVVTGRDLVIRNLGISGAPAQ